MFVDDELEILNSYKNIFENESETLDLEKMANSIFDMQIPESSVEPVEYNILTASQGLEAVEVFKKDSLKDDPVKVVFMDMRMPPGINGLDTVKKIKQLDPRVEFVFVTAYSDASIDEIHSQLQDANRVLYLKKPFDHQEITQLVKNLCSKYDNERIKESFISNVSHELKTPLSSIIGFSDFLLLNDGLNEEVRSYIDIIKNSGKLMQVLISDLIDTSYIQQGRLNVVSEKVCLNDLVSRVYVSLEHEFEAKGLEYKLESNIDPNLEINTDPYRLQQCLIKLLENALKFTDEGGIFIQVDDLGEQVQIQIRDTGIGIPSDKLKVIFDRFHREEDKHHNKPGLGLGLFIFSKVLSELKGEVLVDSSIGEGSTFKVILPK